MLGRPVLTITYQVVEIAHALAYVHSLGVVHGDVQPDHVIINDSGHATLSGFGLSRFETDHKTYSAGQSRIIYLAPEVCNDEQQTTRETDVFSLGGLCLSVRSVSHFAACSHMTTYLLDFE